MTLEGDYIGFNFSEQDLDGYVLIGDFTSADFTDASLVRADLRKGTFNDADFSGADLQRAKLPDDFWSQVVRSNRLASLSHN